MTDKEDKKLIQELLGNDLIQEVIDKLGIGGVSEEMQTELLSMIGKNILQRVILEVMKIVPASEHAELEVLIGGGNTDAVRKFLVRHIPDLDDFIEREAQKEYEAASSST